jgi:hypothetical protein
MKLQLQLPEGYLIEREADVLTLRRPDGSVVARFSVRGVRWPEVQRMAEEDAGRSTHSTLHRMPIHSRRKPGHRHLG